MGAAEILDIQATMLDRLTPLSGICRIHRKAMIMKSMPPTTTIRADEVTVAMTVYRNETLENCRRTGEVVASVSTSIEGSDGPVVLIRTEQRPDWSWSLYPHELVLIDAATAR